MAHHYPKNTTEVSKYCNTCRTITMHLVSDGRLGRCVHDHHKDAPKKETPKEIQQEMFNESL